jgi:hypothetical protein
MIVVIQCAATKRSTKRSDAGHLVMETGMPVEFVAHPQAAPANPSR